MSEEDTSADGLDWEKVARLELHPRRFGLLQVLALDGGRTLSPSECAFELHTSTADAHYHMSVLRTSGLLRPVKTVPVRGAKEHFYCLVGHSGADLDKRLRQPGKGE